MLLPVTWIVAKGSVSALGRAVPLDAIMTRWCRLPRRRFSGGPKLSRFAGVTLSAVERAARRRNPERNKGTRAPQSPGSTPSVSALLRHKLLIVRSRHEPIRFLRIFQRQLQHPRAMRILVHLLWLGGQPAVHFSYRTRHRTVQIRHRLHRLDGPKCLAGNQFRAHLGHLDKYNVTERLLCIVTDSDRPRRP